MNKNKHTSRCATEIELRTLLSVLFKSWGKFDEGRIEVWRPERSPGLVSFKEEWNSEQSKELSATLIHTFIEKLYVNTCPSESEIIGIPAEVIFFFIWFIYLIYYLLLSKWGQTK